MRYSDAHDFFFVHIPKCAGRSVIKALEPVSRYPYAEMAGDIGIPEEEAREAFLSSGYDHAALGPIDAFHLPLPILKEHFPSTFALVERARAFAILREPRARFISALSQRMKEHLGYASFRLEDPVVQDEARKVCAWLEGRGAFADVEYVHFTRQVDYLDVEGRRVVGSIFAIDDMASLEAWLARHGASTKIEHGFERRQPKRWFKAIHPATRAAARLLPDPVRRALYPLWMKSGVFAPAAKQYDALRFDEGIERFIERFYAEDAALWAATRGGGSPAAGEDRIASAAQ